MVSFFPPYPYFRRTSQPQSAKLAPEKNPQVASARRHGMASAWLVEPEDRVRTAAYRTEQTVCELKLI